MTNLWVDQPALRKQLSEFFNDNRKDLTAFGSTVNQTFEAFVFAAIIEWYRANGWSVEFVHPKKPGEAETVRLKFSTRGRPENYSYARCQKGNSTIEIRHQMRVETAHATPGQNPPANLCIDVAVLLAADRAGYSSTTAAPNAELLLFAEAKHMSAFAELVAQFIGMVHEMMPDKLSPAAVASPEHLRPFLFVSGNFLRTAEGVIATAKRRSFQIEFFNHKTVLGGLGLPTVAPPPTTATRGPGGAGPPTAGTRSSP